MGRILVLAIAAYVYGGSSFDGRRPAALDSPLREFKRHVDAIETDGPRVLAAINRLRGHHDLDKALRALNRSL
jgi:hypothetical protein